MALAFAALAAAAAPLNERLGELKPLDPAAYDERSREVIERIELLRQTAVASGNDQAKISERLERIGLQDAIKARDSVQWGFVPSGHVSDVERRYMVDEPGDGALPVRLGNSEQRVFLGGESVTIQRRGLLTDQPVSPEHAELQRRYGAWALSRTLAAHNTAFRAMELKARRAFAAAAIQFPGRIGAAFREMFASEASFQRAVISKATGSGGELLATPTLATVVRPRDMDRKVAALIQVIDAPSTAFKRPIVSGRAILKRRPLTQADPATFPTQTFTTSDGTTTLTKAVINILLDSDWAGEAGHVLDDPMGLVWRLIAEGVADSLEMMFLHGDTAASHQDTLTAWTMGGRYSAGALTTDTLALYKGFRAQAFDDSATVAGGGTFSADGHFGCISAMGAYGADAKAIMGLGTLCKKILASALFTTVDKAGAAATLQTGQIGQIGDTPVVLTDNLAREYETTGLFTDGSGATGCIVYVAPSGWTYYRHVGADPEWDVRAPHMGAQYVGVSEVGVLERTASSSDKPAAVLINM